MRPSNRNYPKSVTSGETNVELKLMGPEDRADLEAFIAEMPSHDLLFLDRDITQPKVIDAWFAAIERGRVVSLCARADGEFVGCTAIIDSPLSWTRHVGELRVLVSQTTRGQGFGRLLIQECFSQALEQGLEKLMVRMTTDQKSAIAGFEALGFRAEAVFRDHVKDGDGNVHDLAVLAHDVARVQAKMDAFGVSGAFGG